MSYRRRGLFELGTPILGIDQNGGDKTYTDCMTDRASSVCENLFIFLKYPCPKILDRKIQTYCVFFSSFIYVKGPTDLDPLPFSSVPDQIYFVCVCSFFFHRSTLVSLWMGTEKTNINLIST